ncbi:helix-turn-helix domain-containing protein [Streptomyces scopuliridis]|uniref:helix-turn-helix domain-containing protein n=1 Tax=Streptomyces scopuliridis TaxID=452529 RepID=UPI0036C270A1
MEGNQKLMSRMDEAGFTQNELAEAVNAYLRALGHDGTVSDRTVRNWLTGKTRWPHSRQREALETVFNCRITELGFASRGEPASSFSGPTEDRVLRRHFISASAGITLTAASTAPAHGHAAQRRVGAGDVERLLGKFTSLIVSDHRYGGRLTIETQASALAAEALALQKRGMLRLPWRGTGIARRAHDELLAHRSEEQVSLLVNPQAENGTVKAMYESWGYETIGEQQPSADGPVLTAMLRAIRRTAPSSSAGPLE